MQYQNDNNMVRETFIDLIECLERQHKKDLEVIKAASVIFPNAFEANLFPDNNLLHDKIVSLLKEAFGDTENWVDYYIYELDYGAPLGSKVITRNDGSNVPMHNPIDLYNWLVEIKDN